MSSLMDILLSEPSVSARFQQLASLIGQNGGQINRSVTGSVAGGDQAPAGSPSHWQSVGHRIATNRYDYTPQDLNELDYIVGHESNWDPNAVNPNGGAYGIPQILPSAHPNANLQSDPIGQIKWMLNYINDRYGGIDQAYQFKTQNGWY